jgi:hypothetical protein
MSNEPHPQFETISKLTWGQSRNVEALRHCRVGGDDASQGGSAGWCQSDRKVRFMRYVDCVRYSQLTDVVEQIHRACNLSGCSGGTCQGGKGSNSRESHIIGMGYGGVNVGKRATLNGFTANCQTLYRLSAQWPKSSERRSETSSHASLRHFSFTRVNFF